MDFSINPRGVLQIDGARLVYRNFKGKGSAYNHEGDRNFSVLIPDQEVAEALIENGWNVRIKPSRNEEDGLFMHLPVKVKFNDRGPNVYLESGNAMIRLDEESIGQLDDIRIAYVDLDIAPHKWEVRGETGRSAYLRSMKVVQNLDDDRFYSQYARYEE